MDNGSKPFQVSLRTLLELTAVAAVCIALIYGRFGAPDRYRVVSEPRPNAATPYVLMYDAQTGRSWGMQDDGTWGPGGMPPGLGN